MKNHIAVWLDRFSGPFRIKNEPTAALERAAAGGTVSAVMAVEKHETIPEDVLRELTAHGARQILCLELDAQSLRSPEALAAAFLWALDAPFLRDEPLTDLVATASANGRDLMARIASKKAAPLLQDCISVDLLASTGEKYLLQGRTLGVYTLPGPLRCWTLRPNAVTCAPLPVSFEGPPATVFRLAPPAGTPGVRPSSSAREHLEEAPADPLARMWDEQPDIMEASVIIGGGRSLESAGNFRLLHALAAPLHAAVGASRTAVDMGYAPPFVQIGQTGVVVSPRFYLACGISGSVFHTTGIKGAQKVAAINKDPSAPIFLRADYGLTEDLFEVLPLLSALLHSPGQ